MKTLLETYSAASSLHFSQRGFLDVSLDELDEDTMAEERDSERRKVVLLDLWKQTATRARLVFESFEFPLLQFHLFHKSADGREGETCC